MPKAPARPWRTAGRYAIFDEIASGGMASIYLGRLSGPGGFSRAVAIKRLHPHLAGSQEFAASFLREARLAARVRHPNVVSIIDVFEDQTDVFLVMEFVVGASLSAVLGKLAAEGRQVPCAIASAILVPVLHGLHAAHETLDDQGSPLGLVHRDVSPQNVIVGADGVPYVLDFGIAKAAAEGDHTRDHVLKGKLSYLSPEQLKGDPVRRQADIYAACVVLWEMLTGSRLFREASAEATMHAVLTQPVLPPSSCAEGLPSRLNAIVLQGLARDPALRFQTARELADVLEVAVPPATAALLSTWVQSLCGESIAELRSRLSSAESATDAADTTTILPLLHAGQALPHDAGELATRVELRPRHDRQLPEPRLAVTKLILLLVALAAAIGAILWLRGIGASAGSQTPVGSAAAATFSFPAPSSSHAPCEPPHPLDRVIALASGASAHHTCALREDHSVWCWGANDQGQLGVPSSPEAPAFATQTLKLDPVVEIAAGTDVTVAILGDTRVATWGKGLLFRPAIVVGLADIVHLAAGGRHACASRRDGLLLCWGDSDRGQLGSILSEAAVAEPVAVSRFPRSIAAGQAHTCAVVAEQGAVYCWGDNTFGQLGLGTTDRAPHPKPTRVPGLDQMARVAAGDKTTFAWSSEGVVFGWGFGIKRPVRLAASEVAEVSAGGKHNCLVRRDGTVQCWGFNDFGQLGTAGEGDSAVPVSLAGLEAIKQVVAGDVHACALRGNGTVVCWGGNERGQLAGGSRDRERHASPQVVLAGSCAQGTE